MHDAVNNRNTELRKANDYFAETQSLRTPEFLFDEFWREDELALMFGPSGAGKSILAMQIAEAIARGRQIEGFRMPKAGSRVLYVDLACSTERYLQRYSILIRSETKSYRFSERLYRDAPPRSTKIEGIGKWLRRKIGGVGVRTIVFDNLNSLAKTADGTRETLAMMRELRGICDEMKVSILAITSSRTNGNRYASEADLMRSRVLCDAADSVFAVGFDPNRAGQRVITQIRSWAAPLRWTWQNAPVAVVYRQTEDAFLRFGFDKRFAERRSDEERKLIQEIKWRVDAGATYREIGDEFGISKTRAHRLRKLWTPDMEPPREVPKPEPEQRPIVDETADEPASYWADIGLDEEDEPTPNEDEMLQGQDSSPVIKDPVNSKRFAAMKRSVDRRGAEIYIEQEDDAGNPTVWYGYNKAGRFSRFKRTLFGVSITPDEGLALPP
jgi:hypothetical protein